MCTSSCMVGVRPREHQGGWWTTCALGWAKAAHAAVQSNGTVDDDQIHRAKAAADCIAVLNATRHQRQRMMKNSKII
jgi:hypothetical protein